MKILENTPTKQVTINGMPFQVPQPFEPGYVVTENEAQALNQLLIENLRNNFTAKLKKQQEACEADKTEMPSLEALQADFLAYADSYEFGVRRTASGSIGTSADPVEREVYKIAREMIKARLKEKGYVLKAVPEEQLVELIERLVTTRPDLREAAQRRVDEMKSLGSVDVGDLTAAADTAAPAPEAPTE